MIGGSAVRFCFPIAYIMSFIKEVRRNTFEWKIEKFEGKIWHRTGNLNIDGYSVELFADRGKCRCHDTYNLCHFRLWADDVSFLPVAYTFSILDYEGRVFVTSMGKILKHDGDEKRILMLTHLFYLKAYNLIGNGTLSVRFSLDRETDAEEQSNPFTEKALNVADNATNTNHLVTKDSATNTVLDGEFINLLETLSNDFYTFYEDKTDTDCVLKVNGAQFSAHRAILSARSSVFSAMFHHDTSENRRGEVNIPDINATVLSGILYYIYSGKIKGLTVDIAASMYVAADKYDLPQLRRECLEFLKLNLTLENFCEATLLAHTYGEMELEESVVGFIKDNFDEILESNIWQQFLKDKPMLTSKLLISVLKMSNKKEVRDSN